MPESADTKSRGEVFTGRRLVAVAGRGGGAATAIVMCLAALIAGLGWLYVLRGLGWLAIGPRVGDSLPLLQLAGFAGQPLARVVVAWLMAGVVAGMALARLPRLRRTVLAALLGFAVLLLASEASFALARNLRFSDVLSSRSPGAGAWLEAALFAFGAAIPGRLGTSLPHFLSAN